MSLAWLILVMAGDFCLKPVVLKINTEKAKNCAAWMFDLARPRMKPVGVFSP